VEHIRDFLKNIRKTMKITFAVKLFRVLSLKFSIIPKHVTRSIDMIDKQY